MENNEQNGLSLKAFARRLLYIQLAIILIYAGFIRMEPIYSNRLNDSLFYERYSFYSNVSVMMLVGFGFLMIFIRTYSLSALTYTFFINAIVIQLYPLLNKIWTDTIVGFNGQGTTITLNVKVFILASYCVASVLIGFGAFIGRTGPKELLIIAVLHTIGYSFNQALIYYKIGIYDAGGSITIHVFGAYFGLGVSWILNRKRKQIEKPQTNPYSNVLAMVGTLFLWIYWPSFNIGTAANSPYQQTVIVANTLYSLTGSCISAFATSIFLSKKISMIDILNATLAGGVAIGASCGVTYYPAIALGIGIFAGAISCLCFKYLTPFLERKIGLVDTCGVHNLHGIPGIIGGVASAIVIAGYNNGFNNLYTDPFDAPVGQYRPPPSIFLTVTDFIRQGGLQVGATLTALGFGLVFGLLTGLVVSFNYDEKVQDFYQDKKYIYVDSESSSLLKSQKKQEQKEPERDNLRRQEQHEQNQQERKPRDELQEKLLEQK